MPSQQSPEAAGEIARDRTAPIDWLAICRRIVAEQRELLAAHPDIASRSRYEGQGAGGDAALVIDRRCEDIVFAELDRLAAEGHSLTAVSEERGELVLGNESQAAGTRVVIDPIDGSLNARRTIPSHSLSIAVASADSMGDVDFGFVYDFGADEEFAATRGGGAQLDGRALDAADGHQGVEGARDFEIVGLEASDPELVLPLIERLAGRAYRLRAVGSIAISLCYVAAGRFDALIAARPCRSVDAAAGQLIVEEAGAAASFGGGPSSEAPLGLDARYLLVASRDPSLIQTLQGIQEAA